MSCRGITRGSAKSNKRVFSQVTTAANADGGSSKRRRYTDSDAVKSMRALSDLMKTAIEHGNISITTVLGSISRAHDLNDHITDALTALKPFLDELLPTIASVPSCSQAEACIQAHGQLPPMDTLTGVAEHGAWLVEQAHDTLLNSAEDLEQGTAADQATSVTILVERLGNSCDHIIRKTASTRRVTRSVSEIIPYSVALEECNGHVAKLIECIEANAAVMRAIFDLTSNRSAYAAAIATVRTLISDVRMNMRRSAATWVHDAMRALNSYADTSNIDVDYLIGQLVESMTTNKPPPRTMYNCENVPMLTFPTTPMTPSMVQCIQACTDDKYAHTRTAWVMLLVRAPEDDPAFLEYASACNEGTYGDVFPVECHHVALGAEYMLVLTRHSFGSDIGAEAWMATSPSRVDSIIKQYMRILDNPMALTRLYAWAPVFAAAEWNSQVDLVNRCRETFPCACDTCIIMTDDNVPISGALFRPGDYVTSVANPIYCEVRRSTEAMVSPTPTVRAMITERYERQWVDDAEMAALPVFMNVPRIRSPRFGTHGGEAVYVTEEDEVNFAYCDCIGFVSTALYIPDHILAKLPHTFATAIMSRNGRILPYANISVYVLEVGQCANTPTVGEMAAEKRITVRNVAFNCIMDELERMHGMRDTMTNIGRVVQKLRKAGVIGNHDDADPLTACMHLFATMRRALWGSSENVRVMRATLRTGTPAAGTRGLSLKTAKNALEHLVGDDMSDTSDAFIRVSSSTFLFREASVISDPSTVLKHIRHVLQNIVTYISVPASVVTDANECAYMYTTNKSNELAIIRTKLDARGGHFIVGDSSGHGVDRSVIDGLIRWVNALVVGGVEQKEVFNCDSDLAAFIIIVIYGRRIGVATPVEKKVMPYVWHTSTPGDPTWRNFLGSGLFDNADIVKPMRSRATGGWEPMLGILEALAPHIYYDPSHCVLTHLSYKTYENLDPGIIRDVFHWDSNYSQLDDVQFVGSLDDATVEVNRHAVRALARHHWTSIEWKQLMTFITGSDTVMDNYGKIAIVINDELPYEWLPTVNTCFHALYLPNYWNMCTNGNTNEVDEHARNKLMLAAECMRAQFSEWNA